MQVGWQTLLNDDKNSGSSQSFREMGGSGGAAPTKNIGFFLLLLGALMWAFGFGVYAHVEMMLDNAARVASGRLKGQVVMAWVSPPLSSTEWFPLSAASVQKLDIAMRQRRVNQGQEPYWGGVVEFVKLKVMFSGGQRIIVPVYFGRSHLYLMDYKTGGMDARVREFGGGYSVEIAPLSAKQMALVRKVSHLDD